MNEGLHGEECCQIFQVEDRAPMLLYPPIFLFDLVKLEGGNGNGTGVGGPTTLHQCHSQMILNLTQCLHPHPCPLPPLLLPCSRGPQPSASCTPNQNPIHTNAHTPQHHLTHPNVNISTVDDLAISMFGTVLRILSARSLSSWMSMSM